VITVAAQAHLTGGPVYVDPSCSKLGIVLRTTNPETQSTGFLYVAALCEGTDKGILIDVVASEDARIAQSSFGAFPTNAPVRGQVQRVLIPTQTPKGPIGSLGVKSALALRQGTQTPPIGFQILRLENTSERAWHFQAGVGGTWLSYSQAESRRSVQLSEIALTVKGGIRYAPIGSKWDFGTVVFFNALPLSHSPASVDPAQMLGVNLRAGYRLPWSPSGLETRLSLGVYQLSMFIPGGAYGIQSVSGPQLLFSLSRGGPGARRPFGLYLKYSPISPGLAMPSLGNRELAIGGAVQLARFKERLGLALTLDISDFTLSNIPPVNSLRLTTMNAGLQLSW
jgi:hypothetical protein